MSSPITLLVVDDITTNRELLVMLLESPDCQLLEASNGPEALRLAAAAPPDLILLDVMMPGMDGFEVCRRLRADPQTAEIPVIMVTALDDQTSLLTGLEAGADDFISTPFNSAELRARVTTITRLNRYRRLHEQRAQFQWIVEQAEDGYVHTNAADEIVFANAQARLWLGLPEHSRTERPADGFLATANRHFTGHPPKLWQDWPKLAPGSLDHPRLLVRTETPQARAFFLEVRVLENSDGRLLLLRDVTERLSTRLNQRSFLTMMSHKLRTPLNAIQGGLELLSDPEDLTPEEMTEFVTMAREGAARLVDTVDDVLRFADLSRSLSPGTSFDPIRLNALVQSVAAALHLAAVTVEVAADTPSPGIPCGAEALEWILLELLENAQKFHPRATPTVHVTVGRSGADGVILRVCDDGITLASDQLSLAGQPFFQSEKNFTGEVPGSGLGLASVSAALWRNGASFRLINRSDGPGICAQLLWPHSTTP